MVTPGYRVPPRRPQVRDPKARWVEYAVACGVEAVPAARMTKAALQAIEAPRHVVALDDIAGDRIVGPVEAAVLTEVAALVAEGTVPAMTALKLARQIDASSSGNETATTARELRLTMLAVRQDRKHLSPNEPEESSAARHQQAGGVVVPGARLEALRRAAASGPSQPSARRRKAH